MTRAVDGTGGLRARRRNLRILPIFMGLERTILQDEMPVSYV
jgi:hypothetical protein